MTIRYNATGKMEQSPSGHYVTYAEHEELLRQLLATAKENFRRVECGELTASDAEQALRVTIQILTA